MDLTGLPEADKYLDCYFSLLIKTRPLATVQSLCDCLKKTSV